MCLKPFFVQFTWTEETLYQITMLFECLVCNINAADIGAIELSLTKQLFVTFVVNNEIADAYTIHLARQFRCVFKWFLCWQWLKCSLYKCSNELIEISWILVCDQLSCNDEIVYCVCFCRNSFCPGTRTPNRQWKWGKHISWNAISMCIICCVQSVKLF